VETETFIYVGQQTGCQTRVGSGFRMKRKVQAAAAKLILSRVPAHASFWLCTNENLRSVADVCEALKKASDDVFRYHVNRDKNDFEVWIRDSVRDRDLAREIARVKTRYTLIRKLSERVAELRAAVKKAEAALLVVRKRKRRANARQKRPGRRKRRKQ